MRESKSTAEVIPIPPRRHHPMRIGRYFTRSDSVLIVSLHLSAALFSHCDAERQALLIATRWEARWRSRRRRLTEAFHQPSTFALFFFVIVCENVTMTAVDRPQGQGAEPESRRLVAPAK